MLELSITGTKRSDTDMKISHSSILVQKHVGHLKSAQRSSSYGYDGAEARTLTRTSFITVVLYNSLASCMGGWGDIRVNHRSWGYYRHGLYTEHLDDVAKPD